MGIAIVDVDLIVSDEELDDFLGGQLFRTDIRLAPESWEDTGKPARQHALDKILDALRRRTPPLDFSDLGDITELKLPVLYGAAERLYQLAMSTAAGGDNFAKQRELYAEQFENSVNGLTPTLQGGFRGTARGHAVQRR
jgi:hypothetical protein